MGGVTHERKGRGAAPKRPRLPKFQEDVWPGNRRLLHRHEIPDTPNLNGQGDYGHVRDVVWRIDDRAEELNKLAGAVE